MNNALIRDLQILNIQKKINKQINFTPITEDFLLGHRLKRSHGICNICKKHGEVNHASHCITHAGVWNY